MGVSRKRSTDITLTRSVFGKTIHLVNAYASIPAVIAPITQEGEPDTSCLLAVTHKNIVTDARQGIYKKCKKFYIKLRL